MRALLLILLAGAASAGQNWQYATYVGGAGDENVTLLNSDNQGNTYVAGLTQSIGAPFEDLPWGYRSAPRGYLMKLDQQGQLIYSKILGNGSVGALTVDNEGNVFVGGTFATSTPDFATPGSYQPNSERPAAFLAKFSPSGEKLFATYFGVNNSVQIRTISLDANAQPVFCGSAWATAVPLTASNLYQPQIPVATPAPPSAYCAQLSADGAQLLFSTLLSRDLGFIAPSVSKVDANGDLIVGGATEIAGLPRINALQDEDRRRSLFHSNADGLFTSLGGPDFGTIVSQQTIGQEIFIGTQNAGTWASTDAGATWNQLTNRGISGVVAAHPLNTRFLCMADQSSQLWCSVDRGKSWAIRVRSGITGVVADPRAEGGFFATGANFQSNGYIPLGNSIPPGPQGPLAWIDFDPTGTHILAVPTTDHTLLISDDAGKSFTKLLDNVSTAAAAPSNPQRLFAGRRAFVSFFDSSVFRSDDGGRTWTATTLSFQTGGVRQLVVDPSDPDTVYAVLASNGAYRSTDAGRTWHPWMPPGLDNISVRSIRFDANGGIWVATAGLTNAFLMKISLTEPAVRWGTLFGGAGGAFLTGMALDPEGKIIVTGYTFGVDLPETGAALGPKQPLSGLVAIIEPDGRLGALRYLGVTPRALDRSADGSLQIAAGATPAQLGPSAAESGRFAGGTSDALWMTLPPDLDQVLQSTWFGGSNFDMPYAIHAGSDGRLRMAGGTNSTDFPVGPNPLQTLFSGGAPTTFGTDGFLAITPLR
jgi:photosystem II stability/assembly factor-like uncharacterized protein